MQAITFPTTKYDDHSDATMTYHSNYGRFGDDGTFLLSASDSENNRANNRNTPATPVVTTISLLNVSAAIGIWCASQLCRRDFLMDCFLPFGLQVQVGVCGSTKITK